MKLDLVGQAYANRSLATAAQVCINLYPEIIKDPNEQNKNKAFLYGIPGRHVFCNTGGAAVRGIFTGGGRCFIAWDTHYAEFDSSGAQISTTRTISNAPAFGLSNSPVQFFPNGNQLFIVSGGVAYVDNGAGPVAVTIGDSDGMVNVFGHGVGWVSGSQFTDDGTWIGKTIVIDGTNYVVAGPADGFPAPTATQLYTVGAVGVASPPAYTYHVAGYQPVAVTGGFLDNSFFLSQAFSRAVNFSPVNDFGPWSGLDVITKDSWPDHVRSILVDGTDLYLFGDDSFEVWTANPASGTNSPFTRIDGASQRVGSLSAWGPITIEGIVYFIGGSSQGQPVAYLLNGYKPTRISQHGQEAVWAANNFGPNCISYSYIEEGHTFWCINFGAQTWCFDTTTGAWHQRMAQSAGSFTPYPVAYHSYIPEFGNGKHLVGGPLSGIVWESSVKFYDDAGQDIKWQKALPHQYNSRNRMYDSRLELEMETGTTPSGTPVVTMDYSDDRGHTFGTSENASQGAAGAFSQRVYWTALGSSYDRVYRLTGQGQGRVALIDLELEQELGTN